MEWQPIETAPRDGSIFLACNRDPAWQNPSCIYWDHVSVEFRVKGRWRTSFHEIVGEDRFTHWMPLPEPPT